MQHISSCRVAVLVVFVALFVAQAHAQSAKRVLVISLDGLDTRYVNEPDKYGLRIPTLRRLMANGVTAKGVVSVFPSVTYPNHTSLITGANPAKHGIVGNTIFESPDIAPTGAWFWYAKDIRTDTIWDAAKRAGKTTGMVSWPVSVGVGDWNVPEIVVPRGSREDTRRKVAETSRPAGLLEEIEFKIPDLYAKDNADEGDNSRSLAAAYILTAKRPDVMLVHLFDLDHFEHDHGPFTPEALGILEKVDGYVERLVTALERAGTAKETAIFITADHGFKAITRQLKPNVLLREAGLIEFRTEKAPDGKERNVVTKWKAAAYTNGAAAAIRLKDPADAATLKRVREIFGPLAGVPGTGIHQVLDRDAIAQIGADPAAVLMLDPADGYTFGNGIWGEADVASTSKGMHGYMPTRPDFLAAFIASGAGVGRRGSMPVMHMTDAGATIASAVGLKLRDATGKSQKLR